MATTDAGLNPLSDEDKRNLVKGLKATEIDLNSNSIRYFRTALYGPPGCGKTAFALKMAAAINREGKDQTWLFYGEKNSVEVLAEKKWEALREQTGLRVFPFPGINELAYLVNIAEANGNVGTIMIDSFSSCGEIEMRDIVKAADRSNLEGYTLKDYGDLLKRWKWLFGVISRADVNVTLICHEKDPDAEEIKRKIKKKVHGSDNQAHAVASILNNILYMYEKEFKEGTGRMIMGKASDFIEAKSSIDIPSREMLDEAFLAYLKKWMRGEN